MLCDELVFSVDAEDYAWRDVVVAAVRWGNWTVVERRTREGHAATRHAESSGQPLQPGVLETASREYRYARELITAHSMEQWLLRHCVSAKDWTAHLRRDLNRARWPHQLDALVDQHPLSDEDAARLTLAEAILSGELEEWAKELAARVAAVQSVGRVPPTSEPLDFPASITQALGGGSAAIGNAARRLQQIDEAFERFRAAQITEPALNEYLTARQLDWVRFDCRTMAFPERDMAAEAALLLREDGERFTGVYTIAHTTPSASRIYYDHIDGSLRDQFLAARTGDLVGPARVNDEYVLYLIQEKVLPTVRDPEVRRRAEEGVLKHALSQQLDRRVRWHSVAQ
jgi:hypothetical protein